MNEINSSDIIVIVSIQEWTRPMG